MNTVRLHYAGALEIRRGPKLIQITAGWAACCSGPKAQKIRFEGRNTPDPTKVTCKRCLNRIAEAQA